MLLANRRHRYSFGLVGLCGLVGFTTTLIVCGASSVQAAHNFSLERLVPTPTGEQTFWVDRPDTTTLKMPARLGLVASDTHDPLLVKHTAQAGGAVTQTALVAHEVVAHVQGAMTLFEKLTIALDVPLVLQHRGERAFGIGPGANFAFSDPRIGAMMQILGAQTHPHTTLHAGVSVFIPVFGRALASDRLPRILSKLVMTGALAPQVVYAATLGVLARQHASIGTLPQTAGSAVGSEVQVGASLAWQSPARKLSIGPELVMATSVERGRIFGRDASSLELLGGVHYAPSARVGLGVAAGAGFFGAAGTPEYRALLRVNVLPYLSRKHGLQDRDEDGIVDRRDACPDTFGVSQQNPAVHGCPEDTDGDGVPDPFDVCPSVAMGKHPDDQAYGCPGPIVASPAAAEPTITPKLMAVAPAPIAPIAPIAPAAPNVTAPSVVVEGMQIVTDPLYFAYGKDVLLPRSQPVLTALAGVLKAHTDIRGVTIEGHTDSAGNPAANMQLSERRAQAVRRALIDAGIAPARLTAHGLGDTRPIDANTSAQGRAKNRRVEFHIVR